MIAFALPWVFGAAVFAAFCITALHLLSVHQPPEYVLPTMRFLPDRSVRAVSRAKRPTDVWLLLTRVALLLLAGLAAAGPRWRPITHTRAAVVVADVGITGDTSVLRALALGADASMTHTVVASSPSTASGEPDRVWPIAWRAAATVTSRELSVDSVTLHLLLREAPSADDAAWNAWRAAWPGRVVMHVPATSTDSARRVAVVSPSTGRTPSNVDDAVVAALTWHAAHANAATAGVPVDSIAVERTGDSTAVIASALASRIVWPTSGVPTGWRVTPTNDSAAALVSHGQAIMGPWRVTATLPKAGDDTWRAIAWWSDGRVAARERHDGRGCVREVAVALPSLSEALLAPSARGLMTALLAACASPPSLRAARLTRTIADSSAPASADAFRAARAGSASERESNGSLLVPALLALALALLLIESRLRAAPRVGAA